MFSYELFILFCHTEISDQFLRGSLASSGSQWSADRLIGSRYGLEVLHLTAEEDRGEGTTEVIKEQRARYIWAKRRVGPLPQSGGAKPEEAADQQSFYVTDNQGSDWKHTEPSFSTPHSP